ncbi:MAG: alpha/beta fold hydrolase [Chloroflexi bacterium]|nr:alpha/beta fold hydrolase [Chloroflexota bacterium]
MKASIDGCQLFYEVAGSGPPLLLVHGLGSDHTTWAEIAPILTRHFQLILPDLRGFGQSDKPSGEYTPAVFSADLGRLLETLGIPQAFVLGHSMGGIVALRLALDFPQQVRALVVSDTSSECNLRARDFWLQIAQLAATEGMGALVMNVETRFSAEFAAQHPEAVAKARERLLACDPQVYAAACRALATLHEDPLTPHLGRISCPTLVLVGEKDVLTPPGAAVIVHRGIAGSQLWVFPGRGHSLYHEAPEEYAAAVIAFLTVHGM